PVLANWYQVKELRPSLYVVSEPADASFFVLKSGDQAILIDSGFGFDEHAGRKLLQSLGVKQFTVLVTHGHCDHVGLNFLANRVLIGRREWQKYQEQKEYDQLPIYYKLYRDEVPWPSDLKLPPSQKRWKPSGFLEEGHSITLGTWELDPMPTPGHT